MPLCKQGMLHVKPAMPRCKNAMPHFKPAMPRCKLEILLCKYGMPICKLATLDCKPAMLDCKPAMLDCKLAMLDCKLATLDCKLAMFHCKGVSRLTRSCQGRWKIHRTKYEFEKCLCRRCSPHAAHGLRTARPGDADGGIAVRKLKSAFQRCNGF